MKIIIIQGYPCLGKSRLSSMIEEKLPNSKVFSLDKYRETLWDVFGFNSKFEKDKFDIFSMDSLIIDLKECLTKKENDYLIIEHNFKSESIGDLCCIAESFNVPISMIYVTTKDYKNHEKLWKMKSEEELEHPGHCANYYIDGKTSGHNLDYNKMISEEIAIIDDCLEIEITFKPFNRNKSLEEVIDFIRR